MTAPSFSARGPVIAGCLTLLLLVGGFGGWAAGTRIGGAVIAGGQIEVERNRQVVQHPDGGVVADIRVTEGARVEAGQVLVRLDDTLLRADLAVIEAQYFEVLARRGRLEAERDEAPAPSFAPELADRAGQDASVDLLMQGQRRLFEARRATMAAEIAQLARRADQTRAQIAGIGAQIDALSDQIALVGQELAGVRPLLDRGLVPVARALALEREAARLRGLRGELVASRAAQEGRITELETEALRLAAARREEANAQLRDLGFREQELAQRRAALRERLARLDLVAPVGGVVLGLAVTTPRAVLRPAEPVLHIVPQDRPLVIAARIPPTQIDDVRPGQPAVLVFPGSAARTTPELTGRVAMVSADVLTDERTGERWYRAEILPDPGQIERLGDQVLRPGMPVQAFIRTTDRTALAWLVQPFADYLARAFREG
jgi:HlyD family secretion protein